MKDVARLLLPPILTLRRSDMSTVKMPGPTTMFLPASPYVNCAGTANAAVLNHCCGVLAPSLGSWPDARLGRYVPTPVLGLSWPVAGSLGKPLDLLIIALTCQPPKMALPMRTCVAPNAIAVA